jgi:hypothetical protein
MHVIWHGIGFVVGTGLVVLDFYRYCSDGRWYILQWWCWISIVIVVLGAGTHCNGGVEFVLLW